MAKKMGFCIRRISADNVKQYVASEFNGDDWVSGNSDLVGLWHSLADAEDYAKEIKEPTEVVPYVDKPLERPEPHATTAKDARYRLRDVECSLETIRNRLDPTKSFGTTAEFEKLPDSYCRALNLLESARELLDSAKEALEPKPNKAVSFVVDKTDEYEDY